ncbi:MAG: 16S rRNA (cytosine(1402)-N(4))-methyltransferase RsmH [Cardiobacteriaceae bacterium]|nr:16S rRNA (cytosine(1402)-N(4))-methyltransferase RsmH [Cardiobacteriaceae bacterium]
MTGHISVLLEEAVSALRVFPSGVYLDATFGRGGHSRRILSQLDTGKLYAIDRDPEAETAASEIKQANFSFQKSPFSAIGELFSPEFFDGILFDLGVSSPQLDQGARGFSFLQEAPLDMRMDNSEGITARDWLMQVEEGELARVICNLGGEPFSIAKRIARAVFAARERIFTTTELAEVIAAAVPKRHYKPHHNPATRTFQAIRMTVNDELGEIAKAMEAAVKLLKSGGVLAVITFHDGEDALVKRFMRSKEGIEMPREIPLTDNRKLGQVLEMQAAIKPTEAEIKRNPRARSARLRVATKL